MGLLRSLRDYFTPAPAAGGEPPTADVTLYVPGMY